jgi:hypothetical protein
MADAIGVTVGADWSELDTGERLERLRAQIREALDRIDAVEQDVRRERMDWQRAVKGETEARESAIKAERARWTRLTAGGVNLEVRAGIVIGIGIVLTMFPATIARWVP